MDDDNNCANKLPIFPFYHFASRKAVELWPKEVYRPHELFPLLHDYKMGPCTNISGPCMPVLLLKRAFGNDCFHVYYQSTSHQKSLDSNSTNNKPEPRHIENSIVELPPLVKNEGTWEGGPKKPLLPEHYHPIQPTLRAQRRPTLHNHESLLEWLSQQSKQEQIIICNILIRSNCRPYRTVYMDGVFDLFHVGHWHAIRQCADLGHRVILGVTGDADAASYKRPPIVTERDRVTVLTALALVDQIVCPCPLVVTESFLEQHGIDLVVHGYASEDDANRQREFFEVPMRLGCFQRIEYYHDLSTTDIIRKIQLAPLENDLLSEQHKWFGSAFAAATSNAPTIPFDPFPLNLRQVIEPHMRKASKRRTEALGAIREASDILEKEFESILNSPVTIEGQFEFDIMEHDLRAALLQCTHLPTNMNLCQLHKDVNAKDNLQYSLTCNYEKFQEVYDNFVITVCAPRLASLVDYYEDIIYYQAFPCLRIIQPGDFSIGPHADVAYGHHPCSVNFYVPLTKIGGTASLFLESRMGSEDFHPVEGEYGIAQHFAGATRLHWTTVNTTDYTRVSMDFRLLLGTTYHLLQCGGQRPGGQLDVYRNSPGYYSCCHQRNGVWIREGNLFKPDARVGFPWTVKDWVKQKKIVERPLGE